MGMALKRRAHIHLPSAEGVLGLPPDLYNMPQEGDCFVSGAKAQALVSQAIKLGQTLRFQPALARVATVAQLLALAGVVAVVWLLTPDWPWYAEVGLALAGFLLSILIVWVVATVGRQRRAYWANMSHAGVVVERDGHLWLAESLAHGVEYSPLYKYAEDNIRFIPTSTGMTDLDKARFRVFVQDVVEAKTSYGFVVFASLFVYCVTAGLTFIPTLVLFQSGTAICSGFACDALTGPYRWRHEAIFQMPANLWADLAERLRLTW